MCVALQPGAIVALDLSSIGDLYASDTYNGFLLANRLIVEEHLHS